MFNLLIPGLLLTASADHPDVLPPDHEVVAPISETEGELGLFEIEGEDTYTYVMVQLDNLELPERPPAFDPNADLSSVSIDPDILQQFRDELVVDATKYQLHEVDWVDRFDRLRGRYVNADAEELIISGDEFIYMDEQRRNIAEHTPGSAPFSVILNERGGKPFLIYYFENDTFSSIDGVDIYTNIERNDVYTDGVYVNNNGQVLTLIPTQVYVNGETRAHIQTQNVRPRTNSGFEGEWITSDGQSIPFVYDDGKLLVFDAVWFLTL